LGDKARDRTVYPTDAGWANKRNEAGKALSVNHTRRQAEQAARERLKNQGGGELTTLRESGRIRSKDTIGPGNESPTRDKQH
jgi:hypothetical protein